MGLLDRAVRLGLRQAGGRAQELEARLVFAAQQLRTQAVHLMTKHHADRKPRPPLK